jgi:hypothetical protein
MDNKTYFYTIKETADILRISPSSASRRLREGKEMPWMEAKRVGNKVIIPADAVKQLKPYKAVLHDR